MRNLLTVEVEEHFHDESLDDSARRRAASGEDRLTRQTLRLLDLLDRRAARATFFVLGDVAERAPDLVREIVRRGHEVGSHGMSHRMPDQQSERRFRADVRESKALLERILGAPVAGYRAPGFAVNARTPWAHRVLADAGYRYSSSACPSRLTHAADDVSTRPHDVPCGHGRSLPEFPPLTRRLSGQNVPVAGGSYLRLLPTRVVGTAIEAMNAEGAPAVLSLRPWEIDGSQARRPESVLARWRHWAGVEEFESKLDQILGDYAFTSIAAHLGLPAQRAPAAPGRAVATA